MNTYPPSPNGTNNNYPGAAHRTRVSPAFFVDEGDGPTGYYHRDQLARIIRRINSGDGERFLIVHTSPDDDGMTYCQAYFDRDGWQVEHQAGSLDKHYGLVTGDHNRVFDLFCRWLDGDPSFFTEDWEKIEMDFDDD
ncbi:hypothetical protein ACFSSC_03295 [Corynebacterium mendelii]|uniref:Uncharacterized protein n=1 Tax=Corynebacterium mendelii TaxID=2765362 RepID=A0A939DYH5_9CORY|nr:hypothetical protein [Corynebacterium mendelii]MBN9643569.1 hypothetical protein [Corynebacterium mendelii]